MSFRKLAARMGLALVCALSLGLTLACGGGGGSKTTAPSVKAAAPTITAQPQSSLTALVGEGATLSVTATSPDGGTLSYQWMKGTTTLTGKTTSSLAFNPVALTDAGSYTVVVTNTLNGTTASTTSNAALLTVNPKASAPTITAQPAPALSVLAGAGATFSVTATSPDGGTLSYQWMKGSTTLTGKTASSLAFNPVALADAGSYTVVVTNTLNGTTSIATSDPAVLTVTAPVAPAITAQPAAVQTVTAGVSVSFTVVATGTPAPTYQWNKGGSPISGATAATYTIASPVIGDSGTYTVTVSNLVTSITSNDALLTVTEAVAPAITTQPLTQVKTAPDSPTFTVVATGSNLTYTWKKNGVAIPLATEASYTVPGFTDLQTVPDSYTVEVSNGLTSVTSDAVTFSVVAPNPYYIPGGQPVAPSSRPLTVLDPLYSDAQKFPAGAFLFGYDEALKNPAWTAYGNFRINTAYANGDGDYQADTRLAAPQVGKSDMGNHGGEGFYLTNGLGFDRGHMVMRSDVSYRYGSSAGDYATYMGNLVPQVSQFNQRIWNDLEEAVGGRLSGSVFSNGLTATFGRIWVYTGPVFPGTVNYWVPSTETYTTNRAALPLSTLAIAIPSACYKIVVAEPAAGQTLPRVMAWLSSNRNYATSESADLWKYVTSVKRIEDLTGLDFFPNLTHDAALTALKTGVDVRGWGTPFEKATGPNVHMIQPSWDLIPVTGNPVLKGDSVTTGDTVTFEAAVSPNLSGGTVEPASCTWTFNDTNTTTTGLTTSHVYTTAGSWTVTFSATDSLGKSNSIIRTINAVGPTANTPPTFTPATLSDVTGTLGLPIPNVTFTLGDDTTTPGSLGVTATSNNQALLPDTGIVPVNTNGNVSLALTPVAGQTGTALVTVTATDGDGAATQKTFTLNVNPNNPPTFTPATLANVSTAQDSTKTVSFTLADDLTAPASLGIAVTSDNQTLLPDGTTTISNVAGAVTLTLHPATGQTGTAIVTVVATDGASASTSKTFTLTVNSTSAAPVLIISQYYEGTSNNKWIEITNIGTAEWDASTTPMSLWGWANPYSATTTYNANALTGTLAVGASMIIKNTSAALPTATYLTGTPISGAACNFNGDDPVFLSPTTAILDGNNKITNGAEAWAARKDCIGTNDSVTWMGNTGTTAGGSYAKALGMNRSYVRNAAVKTANSTYTPAEWTQVDAVEITTSAPSAVDTAAADSTNRLGFHIYIP